MACVLLGLMIASPAWADAPHGEGPRMITGPYLQNLAPTSITVMWDTDQPAAARVVVEGPGGPKAVDVATTRAGEATIDGLVPSSRYRYAVEAGGQRWAGEFATAPAVGSPVPFAFVVMGDTRSGIDAHRRVVERVAQEVPDFIAGTGDMVDEGSHQDQWQQFFDIERPLMRDNVYFPAVGNHDRQGRGRTADSYRALFSVPDNGGDGERYYAFSYATARVLVLDSNEYSFALTDQTAWLERELIAARQDSRVRHIFVVMHHPPYSISLHGGSVDLRERWTPLFEKYAVSAVFSGHDHVYERAEHNGIRYFVTGGAGAPLYPRRPHSNPVDVEAVKKFERTLHYLRVTVTGARLEVTAVRIDGTVIETTAWTDVMPEPASVLAADAPAVAPGAAVPAMTVGGAEGAAAPVTEGAVVPSEDEGGKLVWIGLGGVGLMLAAAVIVVRTLRR